MCTQILQAVRAEVSVKGAPLHLSVSAGLVSSSTALTPDLLTPAKQALRAAKERGRDRAEWFTPSPASTAPGGITLANDLRSAIAGDELPVHYQPISELASKRLVGLEALVRWERPGHGLVPPLQFLEIAERTGQIVALGGWVLERACTLARELVDAGCGVLDVAVNLSPQQLAEDGLLERVAVLAQTRCPAECLRLEVTELALASGVTPRCRP